MGGYFLVSPRGGAVRLEYPESDRVNRHNNLIKNTIFNHAIKQDRVCIFFNKKLHRMRAKDAPINIFTYL